MALKEVSLLYVEIGDTLDSKRSKFPLFFVSSYSQSDIDNVILPNIDIIRYFGTSMINVGWKFESFYLEQAEQ